jgi:hypothetical protein
VIDVLDDNFDDEFPLGDGTAETSADVSCPYCGEVTTIGLDPGGGSFQVCCNPRQIVVRFVDGAAIVEITGLDG